MRGCGLMCHLPYPGTRWTLARGRVAQGGLSLDSCPLYLNPCTVRSRDCGGYILTRCTTETVAVRAWLCVGAWATHVKTFCACSQQVEWHVATGATAVQVVIASVHAADG